ncbi:heterokaryon incompatibility protein-domain-containing protein [Aspergillus pseudotamarii]|uniref:Heterokaryon incompatibility protein-domain-containing protein n=1 Tax=Aspergillus pseudotamarii TaxID=132259 RepID=A0A5N6S8P5_ASPPS|nr:heterokaryon incompatibility protein-domain-containing protein [Aspergillus pseudotamarii]KAE8131002.1 heterokaryon incompatibility protein-domain-containing protein [Aspergillus pseudotamarii]
MPRRNFADADLYSSSSSDSSDDFISETDEDDEISISDSPSEQDSLEASSSISDDPSTHLPHRPCKLRLHPGRLAFRSSSDYASERRKMIIFKEFQQDLKEWNRLQQRVCEVDLKAVRQMERIEVTIPRYFMELLIEIPMNLLRGLFMESTLLSPTQSAVQSAAHLPIDMLSRVFLKRPRASYEVVWKAISDLLLNRLEQRQAGEMTSEGERECAGIPSEDIYHESPTLEQGQIRTLVVFPAVNDSDPLVCRLNTESLEEASSSVYAALSYCWGTDLYSSWLYVIPPNIPFDRRMQWQYDRWVDLIQQCRGFRIGENLKRALLRLRKDDESITLWVDAICINQKNENEKTQQLLQMAKVYRMANHVCVWLGEADSDRRSNRAMRFIPKIMDFAFLERAVNDESHAENWYALAELMRDRWFSRRWIVQEISLAKEASVYCGKMAVPWTEFADAVSILVTYQEKIRRLFKSWREGVNTLGEVQSFGANKLLEATARLFQRDAESVARKPLKGIEYLVTSLSTFDASKSRDIVYSLVSIASDTYDPVSYDARQEDDDNIKAYKLAIDYKLDEVEVYRNFVKYCILSSGSLDIICRPWAMPQMGNGMLPSWIRLLRDSEFGEPTEVYNGRKNGEGLLGPVGSPLYKASRGIRFTDTSTKTAPPRKKRKTKADASDAQVVRHTSSTLFVKGFKLAKVEAVSLANTSGLISRSSLLSIGGWAGVNESPEEVPDHIWRTLIADRDSEGQVPPTWYQRACLRCLEIADTFHNGHFNTGQLLHEESDMLRAYLTRVRNVTWNRKFFRAPMKAPDADSSRGPSGQRETVSHQDMGHTDDIQDVSGEVQQETDNEVSGSEEGPTFEGGKRLWTENDLFGLCPEATTPGDFICILYGCSVPVILRQSTRNPKGFKVIGECYVHGKMEGEAVENCKEGKTLGSDEVFGLI